MKRKAKSDKKQANKYDKIFKENIEAVVPNLIANLLGIQTVSSEEIPDDIQHTKERKPDVLKRITDRQDETFILQIEFQVADEPEMVYRMADYYLMLERKYKLPVEQYVLFVGPGRPKMPTRLVKKRMQFEFSLIVFSELDYRIFLKSDKPEEVILGILADFKRTKSETAVKRLINRLEETAQGDLALKRYFQQLRVLAQLRNLETKINETMDSLANFIDEERDILFIRGERRGREARDRKFVTNLLKKLNLSVEQIADLADVSTDFVQKVKAELAKKIK